MAIQFETTNKVRGPSVIRIHGVGTVYKHIGSDTSTGEGLSDITIKRCAWSTNVMS